MASMFYELLAGMGYHHPLHPAMTHLPIGLSIAGFIFIVLSYFLKQPRYARTAKHCAVLALLAAIPTVILGYFDWQHFYGGSFLFPIKMKLGLAAALLVLLLAVVLAGMRSEQKKGRRLFLHFMTLLIVIGLGYFGGELVYGKKTTSDISGSKNAADSAAFAAGLKLFEQNCSFCHLTDSTDTRVGPGLEGLFSREKMAFSGWPVSADGIRRLLTLQRNLYK